MRTVYIMQIYWYCNIVINFQRQFRVFFFRFFLINNNVNIQLTFGKLNNILSYQFFFSKQSVIFVIICQAQNYKVKNMAKGSTAENKIFVNFFPFVLHK